MDHLLDRAFELTDYHEKTNDSRARTDQEQAQGRTTESRKASASRRSCMAPDLPVPARFIWQSVVGAEATAEGRVRILAASTEIGQGTNTIFSQIAAEALGVDADLIEVAQPDTSNVPNSGPTVASRTCMVVGKLVESAVLGLKQTLIGSGLLPRSYTQSEFQKACREIHSELWSAESLQPIPAAAECSLGRREISGRRLRHLCLGSLRGGSFR